MRCVRQKGPLVWHLGIIEERETPGYLGMDQEMLGTSSVESLKNILKLFL